MFSSKDISSLLNLPTVQAKKAKCLKDTGFTEKELLNIELTSENKKGMDFAICFYKETLKEASIK